MWLSRTQVVVVVLPCTTYAATSLSSNTMLFGVHVVLLERSVDFDGSQYT